MHTLVLAAQAVVALTVLNVWMVRFSHPSPWRGGNAQTMAQEFAVYGLSPFVLYFVGTIKVLLAAALLAGIWLPVLTKPSAFGLAALMLAAVALHVKVGDPVKKSLPAGTMLVLSLGVGLFS